MLSERQRGTSKADQQCCGWLGNRSALDDQPGRKDLPGRILIVQDDPIGIAKCAVPEDGDTAATIEKEVPSDSCVPEGSNVNAIALQCAKIVGVRQTLARNGAQNRTVLFIKARVETQELDFMNTGLRVKGSAAHVEFSRSHPRLNFNQHTIDARKLLMDIKYNFLPAGRRHERHFADKAGERNTHGHG